MASGRKPKSNRFPGSQGAGSFGGAFGHGDMYRRQLDSVASWGTFSSLMNDSANLINRFKAQMNEGQRNISAFQLQARQRKLGGFFNSLSGVGQGIGGTEGVQIRASIERAIRDIESKGGADIDKKELANSINDLMNELRPISTAMSGSQGNMVRNVMSSLRDARESAAKGGVESLANSTKTIQGTADKIKDFRYLDSVARNIATGIQNVADTLSDNGVKSALTLLKDNFLVTANSAKTLAEKQKALADISHNVSLLAGTATGTDKTALENLATKTEEKKSESDKGLRDHKLHRLLLKGQQISLRSIRGVASVAKQLPILKKSFDVLNQGFNIVNNKANAFARTQMAIAAERGAYGRQLRGAGINPKNMMAALAAGRLAGMEDRTVINQMVGFQEQLALARWGESPLINKAGRWGISVYDDRGHTKSNDQMMIEYSRKLNSLTDQAEKLQFLSHMGFRPEQMEYVQNYEREAKRFEEIKRNPSLRGVLEDARILDESGYYAKADAATKIELKRRQILNQNAIDEGVLPAIVRGLHPENWLFSDWTARKKGVEQAKSELAQERLTRALKDLGTTVDKNGKVVSGATRAIGTLSIDDLAQLSMTGGKARENIALYGKNSPYSTLRAAFAQQYGFKSPDYIDKKNKSDSMAIAGIGGVGAGAAALALLGTGPIGWLAAAGLVGGSMAFGWNNPFVSADDGSDKIVNKLRKARTQEELDRLQQRYGLSGATISQIRSKEFQKDDEKARQAVQTFWEARTTDLASAKLPQGMTIDPTDTSWHSDKFLMARKAKLERVGENVTQEDIANAKARTKINSIGMTGSLAFDYLQEIGNLPYSDEERAELEKQKKLMSEKNPELTAEEVLNESKEAIKRNRIKKLDPKIIKLARKYSEEIKSEDTGKIQDEISKIGLDESTKKLNYNQLGVRLFTEESVYDKLFEEDASESALEDRRDIIRKLNKLRELKFKLEEKSGAQRVKTYIDNLVKEGGLKEDSTSSKGTETTTKPTPPPPPDTSKSSLQKEREQTAEEKALDERMRAKGASMEGALAENMKKAPLAQRSDIRKMREMVGSGATREELIRHFGRDRYEQFAKVHPDEAERARKNSGLGVDRAAADQETFRKEDASAYAKAAMEEKEALKSTDAWNRRQGLGVITSSGAGLGGSGTLLGGGQTLLGGGQTLLGGGQIRMEGLGGSSRRTTVDGEGNWGGDPYAKIKPKKIEKWGDKDIKDSLALVYENAYRNLSGWKEGMTEDEYIKKWKEKADASSQSQLWEKDDKVYDENGNVISDDQRADAEFAAQNGGPKIYTRAEMEEEKARKKFRLYNLPSRRNGKKRLNGEGRKGIAEKGVMDDNGKKPGFPLEGMPADTEKDAVKNLTEKEKKTAQATEAMDKKVAAAEGAAASGNAKTSGGDVINKENNINVNQTFNQTFNNSNGDYQAAKEGAEAGGKEGANTMTSAVIRTTPGGVGTI